MKKFTESHEWIEIDNDIATVGITEYAQKELGDLVFIELPKLNHVLAAGEEVVVVESTKAAVDIYSPLTGEIVEVNEKLLQHPDIVNRSAESEGWMFKIKIFNPQEADALMDETAYQTLIVD